MARDNAVSWDTVQAPLSWMDGTLVMLDQRLLPAQERWNTYRDAEQVAEAIRALVIRGAPAIGCAAAMGLAAHMHQVADDGRFDDAFARACDTLVRARPTAVNLAWAVRRQRRVFDTHRNLGIVEVRAALAREAVAIQREDVGFCRAMGRLGAELLPQKVTILTHCNTGALATGGHGTALGMIRSAVEAGKEVSVLADETRPFWQGARLTAWELLRDGIDCTVICDNTAGALMARGEVDCVVVGADRVARNGDVANKIGTYSLAVLARYHDIPFYVAAPTSTIDLDTPDGAAIPIEERPAREVTHVGELRLTPASCPARNLAFDVTPRRLVTALITETGVARSPNRQSVAELCGRSE